MNCHPRSFGFVHLLFTAFNIYVKNFLRTHFTSTSIRKMPCSTLTCNQDVMAFFCRFQRTFLFFIA